METAPLLEQLADTGQVLAIVGANFSGRTDTLKRVARGRTRPESLGIYIGPEVYNCVSGLAATVDDELRLHCNGDPGIAAKMSQELGVAWAGDRNPFTLSGGEQVLLVLACALTMRPQVVSIDCALEQLDCELYERVVAKLEDVAPTTSARVLLADNRLGEHVRPLKRVDSTDTGGNAARASCLAFNPLNSEVQPPSTLPSCRIGVEDLHFHYPAGSFALRNLSFTLDSGSIYLLAGANGSGKSTLAKLLCGVLRPTRGHIAIDGRAHDLHRSPGRVVGYHFQNPDVQLFETSVKQEVLAGARNRGCGGLAAFSCEAFGLNGILHEHPLDLPFTMRKRVALAATVAMGTPWMIIDEPTLGQDDDAARALAGILVRLRDIGVGVVVISHSAWFQSLLPIRRVMRLEGGVLEDG
jgi:energy-coupling factor transport system ATP-binding protein